MAKALYREYRPKTFDEVLGQDRVTDVLRNQVKTGKISHAYIFSGERGTGKTSCAKIFAKAINCKNPINGSPCLECENCKAIEDETTIDVVEMDAASNRRIDDIRNLKDNVIYPPNKLKYKVYIIDEAHMITREAFNALLKIMEEPPSHLIFILATTEIDKVPKTILSRVQKFEFSKISDRQIKEQIDKVLSDRNISIENEAIELIIKKANGAMRDALSILDQVVSFGTDSYSLAEVENILGVVDFYEVDKLTQSIITKDSKKSLESLFNLRNNNKPNKDILDALISYFNDIMIFKLTNDDSYFDNEDYIDFIKKRASEISDLEISDYLDILIEYSNKMKLTENTDVLTEVCLLRLINLKNINNIESRIEYLEKNSGENVVDLVNSILDKKLVNISSISNQNFKAEDSYYHSKEINSQKDLTKVQDKDVTLKESSKENKKEKENTSQNSEASLNANQEEEIKSMLIKTAGGVLNGLFAEEGFNYRIINKDFIIYVKDEFYKIFIETKLGNIENKLRSILRANYNLYVDSYDNIDNNIDKDETIKEAEENKNPKVDETDKLREIFGDELIIE
ncbi:DNA polymerase III subunit gamma/tau [Anaerococcus sp.]|uniref:DNA polymerase III subunit gamma/tau n=1 Tax=Anaerococcus sp. TaxID=1872515 RepID=UPI0028FE006B|nr:DNA polymerase III subunit gamma/tau [Anaerococcus sp.]MDU1828627.1 DNA polymerase III subunit gamma/tau [Anaerococcus sp.]MDU1864700.1 DNA polymerase III subunit gamma/tau [Anaerococcus sp.]